MDSKTVIYNYIRGNKYMALATVAEDGKPEAATVEYVLDGDDLLINTYVYYKKYKNLLNNPCVACVVTTGHDLTLQLEGTAQELGGKDAEDAKQKMLKADPRFSKFFSETDTRFFRITPNWMRLRDYTQKPMQTIEYGHERNRDD